jgi:hypothetical protein
MARLAQKANAACAAAASRLADSFRDRLLENQAPPHSAPGEIPHRYDGPRGDGYNLGFEFKNNNVGVGFSKDQTDFLASYIDSAPSSNGRGAVVGFSKQGSHVTQRSQNYLIKWDQGLPIIPSEERVQRARRNKKKIPRPEVVERPWIEPIYKQSRQQMAKDAATAFLAAGEVSGDVPF